LTHLNNIGKGEEIFRPVWNPKSFGKNKVLERDSADHSILGLSSGRHFTTGFPCGKGD